MTELTLASKHLMDTALATYHFLVVLAHADGKITEEERDLLERYRRALRVSRGKARATRRHHRRSQDSALERIRGSPEERAHALKMMCRVACADG